MPRFSALIKKVLDYTPIMVIGVEVLWFAASLTMNTVLGRNGFFPRFPSVVHLTAGDWVEDALSIGVERPLTRLEDEKNFV